MLFRQTRGLSAFGSFAQQSNLAFAATVLAGLLIVASTGSASSHGCMPNHARPLVVLKDMGPCSFDRQSMSFAGEPVEQAKNDSLLAMSPPRQSDMLGKIAGEGCKGKKAFYQGTMKDIPQPKGDRRPQLPVPPANENDTFWNVLCQNGRSYIEVHPDGSNNIVECGIVNTFHLGECFKKF